MRFRTRKSIFWLYLHYCVGADMFVWLAILIYHTSFATLALLRLWAYRGRFSSGSSGGTCSISTCSGSWCTQPYTIQREGVLSDDGLGWTWQCNVFGHYILVRTLRISYVQGIDDSPRARMWWF